MEQAIEEIINLPAHIEIKSSWQDYDSLEKNAILRRWWALEKSTKKNDSNYEEFIQLLKEIPDILWLIAIQSYAQQKGATPLIQAINNDELGEFLVQANMNYAMATAQNDIGTLEKLKEAETNLLSKLAASYNAISKPSSNTSTVLDNVTKRQLEDTKEVNLGSSLTEDTISFPTQENRGKHI